MRCSCHQDKSIGHFGFTALLQCSKHTHRGPHSWSTEQTCVGIAGIASQPCRSWSQHRGKHGQKQEPRGAGYGLGGSWKSPGLAPVAKLLCFGPFPSLETSCSTGALPLAPLLEHFTALSDFFFSSRCAVGKCQHPPRFQTWLQGFSCSA